MYYPKTTGNTFVFNLAKILREKQQYVKEFWTDSNVATLIRLRDNVIFFFFSHNHSLQSSVNQWQ